MMVSGFTGRSLAEVVRRETGGRGGFLSDVSLPDIQLGEAANPITQTVASGVGFAATGGAKGYVDRAVSLANTFGVKQISRLRPGDRVQSGGLSDHAEDNQRRSATDLSNTGNRGPSPEMDAVAEAIAAMTGQRVNGKRPIVKTWHTDGGARHQLIYRTPAYGDHRGHIHYGVHVK